MSERGVRFPLQTGESALASFAAGSAGLLVATGLHALSWSLLSSAGRIVTSSLLSTVGIFVFFASLRGFQNAYRRRASDVVFQAVGIAFSGGRLDGREFAWSETAPARSEVILADENLSGKGDNVIGHLVLGLAGGDSVMLAEAQSAAEQASLSALVAILQSPRWRSTSVAVASPRKPSSVGERRAGVLACPACGAPAVPTDAAFVACRFCGAVVPIPSDLRARIGAASVLSDVQRRSRKIVRAVLAQPTARRVNLLFALGLALAIALSVVAVAIGRYGFFFVEVGLVGGATALLVNATAERRAFQAVVSLGAIEPARAGDPYECRRCHAPLPPAPVEQVLVACVYCAADNVLGLDLRREVHEAAAAELDLQTALQARGRRRREGRLVLAGAAAIALIGGIAWSAEAAKDRAFAEGRARNDRELREERARAQAAEAARPKLDVAATMLAARHAVHLPRSLGDEPAAPVSKKPVIVSATQLVFGDLALPASAAGLDALRSQLAIEDTFSKVVPGTTAPKAVRLIADAATPLRVLAQVQASLGDRETFLATVGPAGAERSLLLRRPNARGLVLSIGPDGLAIEREGGVIACTAAERAPKGKPLDDAGKPPIDASAMLACLEHLRAQGMDPGTRVSLAPPPDLDLQAALALRDALASAGAGRLEVTLDLGERAASLRP